MMPNRVHMSSQVSSQRGCQVHTGGLVPSSRSNNLLPSFFLVSSARPAGVHNATTVENEFVVAAEEIYVMFFEKAKVWALSVEVDDYIVQA